MAAQRLTNVCSAALGITSLCLLYDCIFNYLNVSGDIETDDSKRD
jgi:hypothetical protein